MSFRKIFFIVIPVVLALAAVIYALLGGFREAEISLVEVKGGYRLAGKPYVGTLKNPALTQLLDEVGSHWESGALPGVLTVAILKEPLTDKDTVEQFIGVLLPAGAEPEKLPASYEVMEVPARQAVRASLDAHASVWPSPDKLRDKAEAFARERGYTLQSEVFFEMYHGPSRLEIEMPLLPAATSVK